MSLGEIADVVSGRCEFRAEGALGLVHRRSVLFGKSSPAFPFQMLVVCDVVAGLAGVHQLEQVWHVGPPLTLVAPNQAAIGSAARLLVTDEARLESVDAWRSPAFGEKIPSTILVSRSDTPLPASMWAIFIFGNAADATFRRRGEDAVLEIANRTITFREDESAITYRGEG